MAISKNNKRWLASIIFIMVLVSIYFLITLPYRSFSIFDLVPVVFITGLSLFIFPLEQNKNASDLPGEVDTRELDILPDTFDNIF